MLDVGDTFERFRIEAVLGEGGMGRVFRAFDTRLERQVALKVVLVPQGGEGEIPDDSIARVLREARAAAALEHPHMVSVYDVGELNGIPYIAMEFIRGATLRTFIGRTPPTWQRKLAWLLATAAALDAAHTCGVVHRDVKPENVMVRDDGIVKVLDFGIARRAAGTHEGHATTPSTGLRIHGTPAYMAPETIGGTPVDGRADQFGWGVMAYELLTGSLPWSTTGGAWGLVAGLLTEAPRPLRARTPELPRLVEEAVLRTLSKSRDQRFPTMRDLVTAIEPFAREDPRSVTVVRGEVPSAPSPASTTSTVPSSGGRATPVPRITGTRAFTAATTLSFAVDPEARFARFPGDFTLKGMFFSRLVAMGGRHVESVRAKLREPPPTGRYLPFKDYPQIDYSRIAHAVATGLHPGIPIPEAMRRLARQDFATFAGSAVGRVSLALMGEASSALLRLPDAFAAVLRGGSVGVRSIAKDTFEVTFRDFYGWVDCYPIGTLEGIVRHYGMSCEIEADVKGALHAVYLVHLRHE